MVYNPNHLKQAEEVIRIEDHISVYISVAVLITAVVTDFRSGRIPNRCILAGVAAGLLLKILQWSSFGWAGFFCGMLIPLLICWIPFCMGAVGAGDVKLFLVIGCLNGGRDILFCIFLSFLFAAGISLGKLLSLRELKCSLVFCIQYFTGILIRKKIEMYPGRRMKGHTIHFSAAIFLGYAAVRGVSLCRNLPLY